MSLVSCDATRSWTLAHEKTARRSLSSQKFQSFVSFVQTKASERRNKLFFSLKNWRYRFIIFISLKSLLYNNNNNNKQESVPLAVALERRAANLVPRAFLRQGEDGLFPPIHSSAEKSPGNEVGVPRQVSTRSQPADRLYCQRSFRNQSAPDQAAVS